MPEARQLLCQRLNVAGASLAWPRRVGVPLPRAVCRARNAMNDQKSEAFGFDDHRVIIGNRHYNGYQTGNNYRKSIMKSIVITIMVANCAITIISLWNKNAWPYWFNNRYVISHSGTQIWYLFSTIANKNQWYNHGILIWILRF